MTAKRDLSERDICTKHITPALKQAGWNIETQIREEVTFTNGKVCVKGNLTTRGKKKRADYILYYKPNIPVAIIEAKDNTHSVRAGIQQALTYAKILDIPYSLKQGIADGFLAPYKVMRVGLNVDLEGWRPEKGKADKYGNPVEDRIYNTKDYDRNLVIDERTQLVAEKVTAFLTKNSRFDKTIIFCVDIEHAQRMRGAIANANPDLVVQDDRYVMQITGDNAEGKRELDNFINPEETYPVIATTSKLMTTGIDAKTCKLIVLDSNIGSMTEFKQIIGRGTRIDEETGEEVEFESTEYPWQTIIEGGDIVAEARAKYYVNGVDVSILNERV